MACRSNTIFAFNCYNHHSLLTVRNPDGMSIFIFSKEGVGKFWLIPTFFEHVAEVAVSQKILKILRIEITLS
jgi:hypothetical protein